MSQSSDMLSMSDEDFAKLDSAPAVLSAEEQEAARVAAEAAAATDAEVQPTVEEQETAPVTTEEVETDEAEPVVESEPELDDKGQPVVKSAPVEKSPEQLAAEEAAKNQKPAPVEEEIDYKAAYSALMKPIKANGKEIPLRNPQELIQLAQMGANYTRKMQEIAPHRKVLLMLENNQLLDEGKLGFLIDLSRKDPAAIQKFLKESGVNPLDIDTEATPTYREGNHKVSDEEATFRSVLDEVNSTETGKVVLQSINNTWDQASKELLFSKPDLMNVMVQQHEGGFYGRITSEMDRQRALGQLPAGMTWLQAYKHVGDQLVAAGAMNDLVANKDPVDQTPPATQAPVATRVIAPKPKVAPNAQVAAAAPSRVAATPAKSFVNPLSMSDDEFLKNFENRL